MSEENNEVEEITEFDKLIQYVRSLERDGIGLDKATDMVNKIDGVKKAWRELSSKTQKAIEE